MKRFGDTMHPVCRVTYLRLGTVTKTLSHVAPVPNLTAQPTGDVSGA